MKTPQIKPDWKTGIYIGNGVVATPTKRDKTMTSKQLREHLGHNGSECRVTISRRGVIKRFGSPDPFDRSADFWKSLGHVEDYKGQK